jgi:hypothetical protein
VVRPGWPVDPSGCPVAPRGDVCVLVPVCVPVAPAPLGLEREVFEGENEERPPLAPEPVGPEPVMPDPVEPDPDPLAPPPADPPPVCAEAPSAPAIKAKEANTEIVRYFIGTPMRETVGAYAPLFRRPGVVVLE